MKQLTMKQWGVALAALLILGWLLWDHYKPAPNTTKGNWSAPPPAAPSVPEVIKPGPKTVVTLDKPKVVKKLKLPAQIKDDPQAEVLATADVKTADTRIAAVAFMNMSTGRTTILAKEIPKPFLRFENKIDLGVRYGINSRGTQEGDVHAKWNLLGIGPALCGPYAEMRTTGEARAMVDCTGTIGR